MFGSRSELTIRKMEHLTGLVPHKLSGEWRRGAYVCACYQGGWSKESLQVKPGQIVRYEVTVKLVSPASNGHTSPFLAGAIFLDKAGKVIAYHDRPPQPEAEHSVVRGKATAPANAASVKLGLGGSWEPEAPAADYVVSFEKARLWKV